MNTKHMNTSNNIAKVVLPAFELLLLFFIFSGIGAQMLFGKENFIFYLLRLVYAPGMIFLVGNYTSCYRRDTSFFLTRSLIYAALFLFLGLCNLIIINDKLPFQSLVQLATFTKIPTYSEMFFTTLVLFLCAALTCKYTEWIRERKLFVILICAAALCLAFFPSDIFGYAVIGVFTDCETYACIPLLHYLGYFVAGIFAAKNDSFFHKKNFFSCFALTIVSVVLFFTPLKPAALITMAAFPVYLLYWFSTYCTIYQRAVHFIFEICQQFITWSKNLWKDFCLNKKRTLPLYFILYSVMFAVMSFCVFYAFIEFNNSFIWVQDAVSQYIPKAYYFVNYVKDAAAGILQGDFSIGSYSFRIGLGNSFSLTYEPIYWILALFDAADIEFAYNFIALLRLFLAGLSVSVLFLYFKRGYFESLLGTLMYVFCGFALFSGVIHAQFIVPMIFLPLLIIAVEEVFHKSRWYLCTIFTALALLSSYYFIYMCTIAMGLYYVGRFLFTHDKNKKNWKYFFTATFGFSGSYFLGVIIGNLPLFTSFANYVGSGRSGHSEIAANSFFYYSSSWLTRFFTYFISTPSTPGSWLKLGFIPLSYLAVVLLFLKKREKNLKFLFLISIGFSIFPIAGFALSGFSSVSNRWSFALALLVSYITVRVFPEFRNLTRRELKILFLSLLPYALIILADRSYRTEFTLTSLAILLGNYVIILCMNKTLQLINRNTANISLLVLCCASLILNGYYQYHEGANTMENSFAKQGHALEGSTDTPMEAFDHYPDESFYRVTTPSIPMKNQMASLVLDYNSIAMFSSTISGPIVRYNAELGNTTWSMVRLGGFDNRTFMNALASVKYYSIRDGEEKRLPYGFKKIDSVNKKDKTYHIYENESYLPLGYTYDSIISDEDAASYNATEKQELMMQSAIIEDTALPESLEEAKFLPTSKEIPVTEYEADGIEFDNGTAAVTKEGATLTLHFNGLDNSETYLLFDGICNPSATKMQHTAAGSLACGDYKRDFEIRAVNNTYSTGQETFAFNLGYRKGAADSCTITFKNKCTFTYNSLKVICQPMESYFSYTKALTRNSLENVQISSDTITGTISVDKEKLLALSIPYQKGWTAYVDGKKTDIQKVNYMYSGIFLSSGDHEIKLTYERPGITTSLSLSAAGIVIFIIALIIRHRRIKIKR